MRRGDCILNYPGDLLALPFLDLVEPCRTCRRGLVQFSHVAEHPLGVLVVRGDAALKLIIPAFEWNGVNESVILRGCLKPGSFFLVKLLLEL